MSVPVKTRDLERPGAISDSCEPPDVYAKTQTPVLWESKKFSELLSHILSPRSFLMFGC